MLYIGHSSFDQTSKGTANTLRGVINSTKKFTKKDRRGAWAAVQDWANKYAEQETREWLKAAEDQVRVPSRPNIGWAKIGFVYAFQQLLKGSSYLEALRDVFKEGGDTGAKRLL